VVPLRQETDFLRVYIEIEQVRFQDRLQIVWDLAPDTMEAAVPTLLWQPVLENAVRHGVTPLAGRGRIVIASYHEGDDLVLEIRDNGRGLPPGGVPGKGLGFATFASGSSSSTGPALDSPSRRHSAGERSQRCGCPSFTARRPTHRFRSPRPISRSCRDDIAGSGSR
jgi:hypothetical protein